MDEKAFVPPAETEASLFVSRIGGSVPACELVVCIVCVQVVRMGRAESNSGAHGLFQLAAATMAVLALCDTRL